MRPKVLFSALALAGAVVAAAIWLTDRSPAPPIPPLAIQAVSRPAAFSVKPNIQPVNNRPMAVSPSRPDSNEGILADLEQPDLSIRKSALQRAREVDDRAIIPGLRAIAARTDDAREKEDILDTINYLELPSVVEDMAAAQAARAAAGLPNPPPSLTNRWTGRPFARQNGGAGVGE